LGVRAAADAAHCRDAPWGVSEAATSFQPSKVVRGRPMSSDGLRGIDARWAREAEDRIDAYDRGEIAAFPIDEVFSSLQSRRRR
jgi:hypothetical protein